MANQTCPHCGGSGEKINGNLLHERRLAAKKTLAEVSQAMGISIQYLSDLERGKRNWNGDLLKAFEKAVPE